MQVRSGCAALLVVVLSSIGLTATTPAQAAPLTSAAPLTQSAQITIDYFYAISAQAIEVHGTVTCTQPTGTAHVTSTVVQFMPFRFGAGAVDVPCTSGPTSWQATVSIYDGWDSFRQITVNALLVDDHGGGGSTSVNGWA